MNASTRTAHRHAQFEHVAVFHDGSDELIDLLTPCITDAVRGGDAVLVCAPERVWNQLEPRLGAVSSELQFIPDDVRYTQPAVAMKMLHDFARQCTGSGARAAMSIGSIPFGDDAVVNEDWIRYEAAVDAVLGHLPVRGLCTYDTATTAESLLEEARLTHPVALDASGRHLLPSTFCPTRSAIPVPSCAPTLTAPVASARDARERISSVFAPTLESTALDAFRLVVTELVTNAIRHGRGPIALSVWDLPEQHASIIDVSDHGPGIDDPFFELRPPSQEPGGTGLWIVGQLAQRVTSVRRGDEHHVTAVVSHTA